MGKRGSAGAAWYKTKDDPAKRKRRHLRSENNRIASSIAQLKIVFPHMGTMSLAFMGALRNLGVEVVEPDRTASRSLKIGSPHSPEGACLPFKMTLGNFIEGLEKGADTIVMIGGSGPCRLGYYSVVQEQILKRLGYRFEIIRTDDPDHLKNILHTMREVSGINSRSRLIKNFYFIFRRLIALDKAHNFANVFRPYEKVKGATTKIHQKLQDMIDQTSGLFELMRLERNLKKHYEEISLDRSRKPVKIGLIGEIFMVLEAFANLDIEIMLGEAGAAVKRAVTLTDWFNERIHFAPLRSSPLKKAEREAKKYLRENAGGESLLSVGTAIRFARQGYDGIVHILPFTCMPEMVAQTILTRVSRDYNIPIMSLVFDEHASKTGVETRLEAFVDMLYRKRQSVTKDTESPPG